MLLEVRGTPEVVLFLVISVTYFLIMYLVVSSVLTNSGLKSEINNLKKRNFRFKEIIK